MRTRSALYGLLTVAHVAFAAQPVRQADARDLGIHRIDGLHAPLSLDDHPHPGEALARYFACPDAQQHSQSVCRAFSRLTRQAAKWAHSSIVPNSSPEPSTRRPALLRAPAPSGGAGRRPAGWNCAVEVTLGKHSFTMNKIIISQFGKGNCARLKFSKLK